MLPGNSRNSTSGGKFSDKMLSLSRLTHLIFAKQYIYHVWREDFQAEKLISHSSVLTAAECLHYT